MSGRTGADERQALHLIQHKKVTISNVRSKYGVEAIIINSEDGTRVRISSELSGVDLKIEVIKSGQMKEGGDKK